MRNTHFFASSPAMPFSNLPMALISSATVFSTSSLANRYFALFFSNHSRLLLLFSFFKKSSVLFCIMLVEFLGHFMDEFETAEKLLRDHAQNRISRYGQDHAGNIGQRARDHHHQKYLERVRANGARKDERLNDEGIK